MNWVNRRRASSVASVPFIVTTLLLLACSPANPVPGPVNPAQPATRTAPKVLQIATQDEYAYLIEYGRVASTSPAPERFYYFHANLTVFDLQGNPVAHAAQKLPSIQDGDWKLNPDGTMEVTWKLRPNVLWQDGTPLTADDFVFGYEVAMDPKLVVPGGTDSLKAIVGVRAADPNTLVVNWRSNWMYGNVNNHDGIPAIPKHLIEPLYRSSDAVAFESSQAWRAEFVGLGPFRITEWALGSGIKAEAFDKFFLGRPKIDRIEINWMPIDVLVSRTLAGAVDLIPVDAHAKPNQLVEIRQQKGANWGTGFSDYSLIRALKFNLREGAPWATDLRFRQAIAYSMDRPALIEAAGGDVSAVTYFTLFPEDPVLRLAEQRGLQKYQYDPARGQQLFADAGWTKGPDGILRNSAGPVGPFYCCRYATTGSENIRESLIWVDAFKKAGLDAQHPVPALPAGLAGTDLRKAGNFNWGGQITNWNMTVGSHFLSVATDQMPNDTNRWTGINTGGYTNPLYDKLVAERFAAVPVAERQEKEVQLVKIIADDLPVIPTYYNPSVIFAREGVTGVARGAVLNTAFQVNIHEWDIK
ncbi:MAG: hypothetical protein EXR58_04070 [Chloroflexi bacterium]|nr:hypothetical protein [Chloroflexota bacterium]